MLTSSVLNRVQRDLDSAMRAGNCRMIFVALCGAFVSSSMLNCEKLSHEFCDQRLGCKLDQDTCSLGSKISDFDCKLLISEVHSFSIILFDLSNSNVLQAEEAVNKAQNKILQTLQALRTTNWNWCQHNSMPPSPLALSGNWPASVRQLILQDNVTVLWF